MARKAEYDAQAVIEAATETFWQNGYEGTGIRELLAASGLNRRALYEKFGGKDGLYIAALAQYRKRYIDAGVAMLNAPNAGLNEIRELFRLRLNHAPEVGCLMLNTCSEHELVGERLFAAAWEQHTDIERGLKNCVRNAQSAGTITDTRSASEIARFLMASLHGMSQLGKSGAARRQLREVADTTLALLERAGD